MRCYVVFGGAVTILVVSTFKSATHPDLAARLKANDINRMILMEIPIDLVKERYQEQFERVAQLLSKDDFRVVDYNGASVLNKFAFSEMGVPIMIEF
ncbi:hypothetical protein [Dethiosulfatarculus sandiegensis]|uniref:Uncharacterized protein n=1 Tax=Dethiosulfatarculus sandiegensis TaxID=1429043 RepID=A0A0D2J8A2_9BACT|nr:hypothetical protein [Dethiosulfatarculus sandiegensis]KIX11926.1 hypothetical protein X474_21590 [Dethiosulfatarculus sandiegensis]